MRGRRAARRLRPPIPASGRARSPLGSCCDQRRRRCEVRRASNPHSPPSLSLLRQEQSRRHTNVSCLSSSHGDDAPRSLRIPRDPDTRACARGGRGRRRAHIHPLCVLFLFPSSTAVAQPTQPALSLSTDSRQLTQRALPSAPHRLPRDRSQRLKRPATARPSPTCTAVSVRARSRPHNLRNHCCFRAPAFHVAPARSCEGGSFVSEREM